MSHILIVDDSYTTNKLISRSLQLSGVYQISCAYSGNEALELVYRLKPDLIILKED